MRIDALRKHPFWGSRLWWLITIFVLVPSIVINLPSLLSAETASPDEMTQVCQNWLTHIVSQTGGWAGIRNPYITGVQDIIVDGTLVGRFFEIHPIGYVVVPVLKELPPVKAYSDRNALDIYEADGYALLLREVLESRTQLYVEIYGSLDAVQPKSQQPLYDFTNRERWDIFAVSAKEFASSTDKSVMAPTEGIGPLLTTAWHQGPPYNNLCPLGDGGRCVVGCVATAAAQIIYYHRWPPEGEGSKSYYWHGDNSCGGSTPGQMLSADFSDPYLYDDSPEALAELCYEMGVAFRMDYGVCGSGAYTMDGATIFPRYFRYDDSAHAEHRSDYSSYLWFKLIQENIDRGRPILYRINLHAIVCDGWRVSGGLNQYHFNYGWGGSNNSWYTVDNLYCPWSGCDPMVEAMVVDLIPLSGVPWLAADEFTDDAGDGDGIPENGETIEMTITLANYGGAAITDVSVNLSIDDASLPIIDGSTFLGTIDIDDSASNTADPFVFEIPLDYTARLDSFICEISWAGGTRVDTLIIEQGIGGLPVLLVDDDNNTDANYYYEQTLRNMRIPYGVWDTTSYVVPDSAYLADYDIVIWMTGNYHPYPLNSEKAAAMRAYLDQGGKLFLTGQRIAGQLAGLEPDFLNNYLRASYQSTQPIESVPLLIAESGCEVFDGTETIVISGTEGAGNQLYPDLIAPVNGSVAELLYVTFTDYGAISYTGDYQLVFFSFGFEAIESGSSRWHGRDSTMADILDYFGYERPNLIPVASDVTVIADDPQHVIDHTPEISWSYFDAESAPQAMYQIQIGTDYIWTVPEIWDSGPLAGSDTSRVYDGPELEDGVRYFVRVRVFDGALWSDWSESNWRMNSAPSAVTDMTPDEMQGTSSSTPTLSHVNAADTESDILTYSYELYADTQMTRLLVQASGIPQGPWTTEWHVTVELDDDSCYFWRVRGRDTYEDGPWSHLAVFWVNSDNQSPLPFDLTLPEDGSTLPDRSPRFEWTVSTDPDPYDHVTYTLYYDTDPDLLSPVKVSSLDTTGYAVPDPLEFGTTYYWKVRAQDEFAEELYSSQVFSFSTITRGDANGDGRINIGDAIFIIAYIFSQGPPPDPIAAGDPNCDGTPTIADAVFLVNYIFKGGPAPDCE